MSDEFCKQVHPIRREVKRVSRELLRQLLAAEPAARAELAAQARVELSRLHNVALGQLPPGGCHGALCVAPMFEQADRQLAAIVK